MLWSTASERRGENLKRFEDFYVKAKASIWPWLSYMCRVRSTPDLGSQLAIVLAPIPPRLASILVLILPGFHTVDYAPFIKSQLNSMQLTLGPYVVQIWARNPQNLEKTKRSESTVWSHRPGTNPVRFTMQGCLVGQFRVMRVEDGSGFGKKKGYGVSKKRWKID